MKNKTERNNPIDHLRRVCHYNIRYLNGALFVFGSFAAQTSASRVKSKADVFSKHAMYAYALNSPANSKIFSQFAYEEIDEIKK